MRAPGERGEHLDAVGLVGGLAEDSAAQDDGGVGGQHGLPRLAGSRPGQHRLGLPAREAPDVVGGRLSGVLGFVDVRGDAGVSDADLAETLRIFDDSLEALG